MCNKMSDVRLSNASPTVERVDARQPDAPRPSARRNLFGRPDPEEIRRCLQATIEEDVRRVRDEYNFDPVRERPLSPRGAYEWEEDRDAPEFFRRQPHGSQRPRGDQDPQDGQEARDGPASRKRRSGDSGPCSSECQSKRSHTDRGDDDEDDDDDDEDQSGGAASQAVKSTEESCAEVQ